MNAIPKTARPSDDATTQRDTFAQLCDAIRALVNAPPRISSANYNSRPLWRADTRTATKDRALALDLLREVEPGADLGRFLSHVPPRIELIGETDGDGRITRIDAITYTAGQYYPTEYRGAVVGWLVDICAHAWVAKYQGTSAYSRHQRARLLRRFGRRLSAWL